MSGVGVSVIEAVQWQLTRKEGAILDALYRGGVWSRDDLLREIGYERPELVVTRTIDAHICKLRRKTGLRIDPVWGVGYELVA